MKTILIDPFTKTITEGEYDGSLDGMYKLLNCDMVEAVYANKEGESLFGVGDCLFVDEEGLLKNLDEQAFFIINGKPLAGRAMTVGCNEDGDTIEAKVSLADLNIQWTTLAELRGR